MTFTHFSMEVKLGLKIKSMPVKLKQRKLYF
jgi:hypothetical protein